LPILVYKYWPPELVNSLVAEMRLDKVKYYMVHLSRKIGK